MRKLSYLTHSCSCEPSLPPNAAAQLQPTLDISSRSISPRHPSFITFDPHALPNSPLRSEPSPIANLHHPTFRSSMGHRHNRRRTRSHSRGRSRPILGFASSPEPAASLFEPPAIPLARSAYIPRVYEPLFTPAPPAAVLAAASHLSHVASQPSSSSPTTKREFLLCISFKHHSLCMPTERRGQQDGWAAAQDSVRFLFDGDVDFIDAPI